jgi:hypothetical protein
MSYGWNAAIHVMRFMQVKGILHASTSTGSNSADGHFDSDAKSDVSVDAPDLAFISRSRSFI